MQQQLPHVHHLVNSGAGPNSTLDQISIAEELSHQGAHPGDKVAVLADDKGVYWARLARLRVAAQVGRGGEPETFWQLPDETEDGVYHALASVHVEMVLGQCTQDRILRWTQIAGTSACAHWIKESGYSDSR
jgi:hypothetical protein